MRFLIIFLTAFLFTGIVSVNAKDKVEGIVAVVNDDIITASDLFDRYMLVAASSGLPNTVEVRNRFLPQILNVLIDEKLQLQEAARLQIEVNDSDILRGVGDVAAQNNQSADDFMRMLSSRNLPVDSLKEQVKANIAWQRVIGRRLRPQIDVTQQDIDAEQERLLSNAGKTEYRVAEIFLPIDDANPISQVRDLAGRIVTQLAAPQADFRVLARQFSQNASASNGGSLGWVFEDQLPEDVAKELAKMEVGEISRPIKTLTGYHIVRLQSKRVFKVARDEDIYVELKQIFLPYGDRDEEEVMSEAEQLRSEIGGCLSVSEHYARYQNSQTGDQGRLALADMPQDMRSELRDLAIAEVSEPISLENGILLALVCDRRAPESNMPSEEDIARVIGQERLEVLQRRHLLDLRATSFIERRV